MCFTLREVRSVRLSGAAVQNHLQSAVKLLCKQTLRLFIRYTASVINHRQMIIICTVKHKQLISKPTLPNNRCPDESCPTGGFIKRQ